LTQDILFVREIPLACERTTGDQKGRESFYKNDGFFDENFQMLDVQN
jgi:hypothetical protein